MSEKEQELAILNERYRTALEIITDLKPDFGGGIFHDSYSNPFQTARNIAKKALKNDE